MAVSPVSVRVSWLSPRRQKTASPAAIRSSRPSSPLTHPGAIHDGEDLIDRGKMPRDPSARLDPEARRLHGRPAGERLRERRNRHVLEPVVRDRPRRSGSEAQPAHSRQSSQTLATFQPMERLLV